MSGRLKFRLEVRGGTEKEKEEKEEEEKEKVSHMCESIGHRPLRGRCPSHLHIKHSLAQGQRVPLTI